MSYPRSYPLPTACLHAEEAREVVMVPNDENEEQPITLAGARYCTACHALIVHLGEGITRVDIAVDDLT